jgi:hypothetical protein
MTKLWEFLGIWNNSNISDNDEELVQSEAQGIYIYKINILNFSPDMKILFRS